MLCENSATINLPKRGRKSSSAGDTEISAACCATKVKFSSSSCTTVLHSNISIQCHIYWYSTDSRGLHSSTTTCRSALLFVHSAKNRLLYYSYRAHCWYSYCTTERSADNIFHLWKRGSAASAAYRTALPRHPAFQTPLQEPRLPEPSCFQRITCTREDKLWTETTLEAPSCFSIARDLEGFLQMGGNI